MSPLLQIDDYMDEIHRWIEDNIDTQAGLGALSERLGYSKRMIQMQFKKEYHATIGRYIQQRRLHRAAIMLRMTTMSITDISTSLHYSSHHNFCRAFKRYFNITPTQFRNTQLHEQPAIKFPSIYHERDFAFEIKNIPKLIISGEKRTYTDCIYNPGLAEEKLNWLQQYFLNNTSPMTIASRVIPDTFSFRTGRHGRVNYSAIVYSPGMSQAINSHHAMDGLYLHCHFHGALDSYKKLNANIYQSLLPDIGMTQRYARKIEVFHHMKETPQGPIIRCEQYIPIY
ncbi:helix-turn-helix transcriptional regulator [Aeromonas veronii]|uniref:Helix-turn-helix domain-containing protein n=1 Tax=Aeromonas veronii TaxID=654 RepID=A0A3A9IN30_AERVE|nr:helix-turn-helix domain-containing protein [Aeromonas veronii]MDD1847239.1 helix-turn-helix transcriptional regulator [Aeromonas veronii]RKJ89691.1 helix-turn-helix domain-containing protein [Aeromonas veronii]